MVAMTAPQQFSPDGHWWWDGTQWIPASEAPVPQQPTGRPPYGEPLGQPPAHGQPAPYGQAPYGYPAGPSHPGAPSGTDGKAIGSLILSILWLFGLGSIAAVVLGHVSRSQAGRQGRQPSGVALAGLIIGYIGIAGALLIGLVAVVFKDEIVDAVDTTLELQSAAEAEHNYHDGTGTYTSDLEVLEQHGYVNVSGDTDIRIISATDTTFCISATTLGETQYVDQNHSTPTSTPCG